MHGGSSPPGATSKGNKIMTDVSLINSWLKRRKEEHTHMIVAVDKFDYDDYPVFVSKNEDVNKVIDKINSQSMQMVMEVYNLNKDLEEQLKSKRSMNI